MSNTEIERRFLVDVNNIPSDILGQPIFIRQGYISTGKNSVRVRIDTSLLKAELTLKGYSETLEKPEFNYKIPFHEADEIMSTLCEDRIIDKTRYEILGPDGFLWELDIFRGSNQGLVIAEIELVSEDQYFHKPAWVGEEITRMHKYSNACLSENPYTTW